MAPLIFIFEPYTTILRFYLFNILAVISSMVWAQQPYTITIDIAKGLPSNAVYSIKQDKLGFIWVATDEGLFRYDGINYVSYQSTTQTSKAGSNILVEEESGRVWYQNFDGFCYYVQNEGLVGLKQNKPMGFFPFGLTQKHLFVTQQNGVDVFDLISLKLIKTIPFPCKSAKHSGSNRNYFFLIGDKSVFRINPNLTIEELPFKLPENEDVHQLYPTDSNVFIFSKYNENKQYYELSVQGKLIKCHLDASEFLQGLTQFQKQKWVLSAAGAKVYEHNKLLSLFPEYSVSCVFKDKHNHFWIGTNNKGILLVPNLNTQFLSLAPYEPSLILPSKLGCYIFTKKDEWLSLSKEGNRIEKRYQNKGNSAAYYAYFDSQNQNLFVSSLGTTIFPNSDISKKIFDNAAIKDIVKLDDKYYAYSASGNAGIFLSPTANVLQFSEWDSLFNVYKVSLSIAYFFVGIRAKSVAYDAKNKAIYFATNNGLYKRTLTQQSEVLLKGNRIYGSKLIANGSKLFVHLPNGELLLFKNDSFIYKLNDLPSIGIEEIKRVKQFGEQLCVIGDQLARLVSLDDPSQSFGELTLKFNYNEMSDILLEENRALLLTQSGLIKSPISKTIPMFSPSDFVLHKISINNVAQEIKQKFDLSYTQNNIVIHFSLLDYIGSNNGKIAYSINNEDWVQLIPKTRSIEFASLSPGDYAIKFKVNGTLINHASIRFVINKPFWLHWWFIALLVCSVGFILFTYYRWQINLLMHKNKLVTEKMALENELNKSMLTSIKSQMNPHFFYNALNTIQSYIFINDKKNASTYLSKFSKLTRLILEMSEKEYLRIGEEIEGLQLYLSLEKMRFEDNLNYSIEVAPEIDIDLYKVPPMLIQPYVENAIKHGLLHIKTERKLQLTFSLKGQGFLEVVIDDNGIGRKRSALLNQYKAGQHQSFANKANETRLAILNKDSLNKLGIEIIDKQNEVGESLGTRVILQIPIY